MRQFRGKDIETGEWRYGYLSYSEQQDRYYIGTTELLHPVDPDTVGQYTGLKDKAGKEIYEGDIIEYLHVYGDRHWIGKIVYKGHRFCGDGFYMTHHDDPTDIFQEIDYVEIIGNTTDNPDLL